ncbi:MAG: hypothetical protein JXB17_12270 [Bacteroidales bacterium]|nr:hypothetical protein [Bacteroidales bacterium]
MNHIKDSYKKGEDFWLPLDNAAKIFPAVQSKEMTVVIRVSAVLKERIKIGNLMKAIHSIEERFPYYKVRLKKGFFWYFLEYVNLPISLEPENQIPCREFNKRDKNKLMFRILVKKNRISLEISHILTDGGGAFDFFKSLLILYLKYRGTTISENFDYIHPDSIISKEEFEDSYNKYFKENIPTALKQSKAFHLPFSLNTLPRFDVLIAILSINEIKNKAKEKGVNITIYLIALYLYVLQDIYKNLNVYSRYKKFKKLRIQVPVNLRNIYPSKSMRNFSLFVMPEIDLRLGHYTFEEIIKTVYHRMQLETDEKLVNKIIARNVGGEKKIFVRGVPLFIKNIFLNITYYTLGINQYSGVLTNLGKVEFPQEISKLIEYFVLTPPPPHKKLKINCGVIGFNDKLVISFGNVTRSKEFEKKFLKFLVLQGIKVKLTTY